VAWLSTWWHYDVVDGYKGPLLLGFVAFVVTFAVTRTITRLIRDDKGPFHNISGGGVHIHHSVPGVVLLIIGGFTALGSPPLSVWTYLAGLLVGIGASLVLDEFAMIFHLEDVYWSNEGQLSVDMVTLATVLHWSGGGRGFTAERGRSDRRHRHRTRRGDAVAADSPGTGRDHRAERQVSHRDAGDLLGSHRVGGRRSRPSDIPMGAVALHVGEIHAGQAASPGI